MDMMANAKVVVQAPPGTTLDQPENIRRVNELVNNLRGLDHIVQPAAIVNPLTSPGHAAQISPDRTIAYLDILYDEKFIDIGKDQLNAFKHVVKQGRDSGLTVEATGTLFNGQPPAQGLSELIGFGVALIVMIIAFASVVAASLPIITAIFGVGISIASITGATVFLDMDTSALMAASMIGIAVAIDYSLFIVSRFRHELNVTHDRAHAAGRAVGTAGSSVVFAGLTVVIALLGLSVVGIPMMAVMGWTAAFTVAVAVLTAITLLPAVLGLFGGNVFAMRVGGLRHGDEPDSFPSNGLRWVRFVSGHPIPVLLFAVSLLGVVAIPVTKLELGMDMTTGDSEEGCPADRHRLWRRDHRPAVVVVDGSGLIQPQSAYSALAEAIRRKTACGGLPAAGRTPTAPAR